MEIFFDDLIPESDNIKKIFENVENTSNMSFKTLLYKKVSSKIEHFHYGLNRSNVN